MPSQSTHFDVIVVGGGVMGCATAATLARSGARTLLLEQFAIGHTRGSSHGRSRIFRLAYDDTTHVRLAREALPRWHALAAHSGTPIMRTTGGLDLGPAGSAEVEGVAQALQDADAPFTRLDDATLAREFPQFRLAEGSIAVYQPDAAVLDADACVAAFARAAEQAGAVIRVGAPATAITLSGAGVAVQADQRYSADRLVVCAGSWAGELLRQVGLELPLRVTREQVAYFAVRDETRFAPERFPIFIHHATKPNVYGFPVFGLPGVKVAFHGAGPTIDPHDTSDTLDAARLEELRAQVMRTFPDATGEVLSTVTCRYTMTPDELFILDLHPTAPQIVVISACSGHGFKFAPMIGQIAADLALRGASDFPLDLFRLRRFGG